MKSPLHPSKHRVRFWARILEVAAWLFAGQAVTWVVLGSFDPFGMYDQRLAWALVGRDTWSEETRGVLRFCVGLLGATTAGFFVLVACLARHAIARGERWAVRAVSAGVSTWFLLDCGLSLWVGASFNVWLVNLPCLFVLGVPLAVLWRGLDRP
jgi:hypothetical protein